MIKLKSLLLEGNRVRIIPENKWKSVIAKYCPIAAKKWSQGIKLYRTDYLGINDSDEGAVVNPTAEQRHSKDNDNNYMMYMDTSPYWKGYPSRSWSLICGGNYGTYEGDLYKVYPIGNPTFAVSSVSDFVDTKIELPTNPIIRMYIRTFSDILSRIVDKGDIENTTEFKNMVNSVFNRLKKWPNAVMDEDNCDDIVMAALKKSPTKKNAAKLFYSLMTPRSTKTRLKPYSTLTAKDIMNECWTEGKCLLIPG